jgi:hypothetical protein
MGPFFCCSESRIQPPAMSKWSGHAFVRNGDRGGRMVNNCRPPGPLYFLFILWQKSDKNQIVKAIVFRDIVYGDNPKEKARR